MNIKILLQARNIEPLLLAVLSYRNTVLVSKWFLQLGLSKLLSQCDIEKKLCELTSMLCILLE